jgi:UDP-glucose 4-epimerase
MNKRVVVTGGGGYIGKHAVLKLLDAGYEPYIIDNFSRSKRDSLNTLLDTKRIYSLDINDDENLSKILDEIAPIAVMHFAALAYVGESVNNPMLYYHNNVSGSITLLRAMSQAGIEKFIFSSTCATYGVPNRIPIDEEVMQVPINPYGESKLLVERILHGSEAATQIKSVIFRYFNAAGADALGRAKEEHYPETHLIPLAIMAALGGEPLQLFGDDYDTPDGTCIRDYIHVSDIAEAHFLGLEYLIRGGDSAIFNLGTGSGYSVKEILQGIKRVTGIDVPCIISGRRPGDAPRLVASNDKIRRLLNWRPVLSELDNIIATAWNTLR